jgi:anti-sigma factor RsiW
MNHPKIAELLPWYVNGALGTGDRQAAALEVASCDECAKDVEEFTQVQAAMLELEAEAPEPNEYAFARALSAVEEEERKKRLGHPWTGWWWALTPFRRAIVVSSVLGVLVLTGIIIAPKPLQPVSVADTGAATPIQLESLSSQVPPALNYKTAPSRLAAAAPVAMPVADEKAVNVPVTSLANTAKIARSGGVGLLVRDVEGAIAGISEIARAQGGEVLSLNDETPSEPGVRHTAQMQVSVPEVRFDATVAALGKIGGMKSRTVAAENVGGQIVDTEARLRNLRSAEADYLKIMNRAGKIDEVLAVENQLSDTRGQIEQLEGQDQALKHRVAYSTINVDLEDEVQTAAAELSAATQVRDSWIAALRSVRAFSVTLIGGILWGVAYAPYVLGVALLGGFVAMRWRRSAEADL